MDVVWLDPAIDALDELVAYIARDKPTAALQMRRRILGQVDRLVDMPYQGRIGRVVNTRELVIAGTPYIVIYRVRGHTVEILRVLHGARRRPKRV